MPIGVARSEPMWQTHVMRPHYDVVIVGAGVHGLATAYYLTSMGVKSVAVLDKGYIGGGNAGRNTAILRANYVTPEGIRFYAESLRLYKDLSQQLDYNLLMSHTGRLDLGHTDTALSALRQRAETNVVLGVDSQMIDPGEVKDLEPAIDLRKGKHLPIMGALYHPPAGVIRHDAVVWAYARGADRGGAHVFPFVEVTGFEKDEGKVSAVITSQGRIGCGAVLSATAGWSSTIASMVGVKLPVTTFPLQAFVTEPLKPFMKLSVSSANLHVYVWQTVRGEMVIGGSVDPYTSYRQVATVHMLETLSAHALELFPALENVRVLRQWAGICDMTPDYAPIMSRLTGLENFFISAGWGTWGFKAGPAGGRCMAEFIASGVVPELISPFYLERFADGRLVNEKAAAPAAALH